MEEKKNQAGDHEKTPALPKKDRNNYLNEISKMSMGSLVDYAIRKILIPYGKKAILDILNAYFYSKTNESSITGPSEPNTSYNNMFSSLSTTSTSIVPKSDVRSRPVYAYEDIIFERYEKAEGLLNALRGTLKNFNRVKVSDFYEFLDMEVAPNDYSFGWTNLDGAEVIGVKGGYRISLPRAIYLK